MWTQHSARRWRAWPPLPPPPRRAHQICETERIIRACNAFGTLNLPLRERGPAFAAAHVRRMYRTACNRMRGNQHARRAEAYRKLTAACRLLSDGPRQLRVRAQLIADGEHRPVTRAIRCTVNARAIEESITVSYMWRVNPGFRVAFSPGIFRHKRVDRDAFPPDFQPC